MRAKIKIGIPSMNSSNFLTPSSANFKSLFTSQSLLNPCASKEAARADLRATKGKRTVVKNKSFRTVISLVLEKYLLGTLPSFSLNQNPQHVKTMLYKIPYELIFVDILLP
ncbi:unnamed protein product, partial [Vitis vinifera]